MEWAVHPWGPVIADVIKSSLESMTVEELNLRMEMRHSGDESVIPGWVIDELLDAPNEMALANVPEVDGVLPARNTVDAIRRMFFDAGNEYLAQLRGFISQRRPSAPPPPGNMQPHRLGSYR
ncbi:unnamed protein product, partial [Laminaria digitata]